MIIIFQRNRCYFQTHEQLLRYMKELPVDHAGGVYRIRDLQRVLVVFKDFFHAPLPLNFPKSSTPLMPSVARYEWDWSDKPIWRASVENTVVWGPLRTMVKLIVCLIQFKRKLVLEAFVCSLSNRSTSAISNWCVFWPLCPRYGNPGTKTAILPCSMCLFRLTISKEPVLYTRFLVKLNFGLWSLNGDQHLICGTKFWWSNSMSNVCLACVSKLCQIFFQRCHDTSNMRFVIVWSRLYGGLSGTKWSNQ